MGQWVESGGPVLEQWGVGPIKGAPPWGQALLALASTCA